MQFTKPKTTDIFVIASTPAWPSVVFETDADGPHDWNWTIQSGSFKQSGSAQTTGNSWDAQSAVTNFGGTVTVTATAGPNSATITIKITGTNPSMAEANAYLGSKPGSSGFDKILQHESRFRNFTSQGDALKSFDNGYGMCQLTTPAPSFEQVWNWQSNIDGGLALFAAKREAAVRYLSQSNRTHTDDQVTREAVCRWNGGSYHVWDASLGQWVRPQTILCDSLTGSIGWDMTDPENSGKTEAELHARDSASYSRPRSAGDHWKYLGICYADAILG